jgi:Glycosyl hydrolases family 25
VHEQDIHFAFIKASQADFTDLLFDSHWTGAKMAGILRGAYHFLDPKADGTIQAETYLRKVKFESGDLPPVLDLEELPVPAPQATKGSKGSQPDTESKQSKGSKGGNSNTAAGMVLNAQIVSTAEK